MAEPKENSQLFFLRKQKTLFNLFSIGYHDFRRLKSYDFYRAQCGWTIHYVRNGEGILDLAGKSYNVQAGDFFFIPPDEPMLYVPKKDNPWRYFWFDMRDELAHTIGNIMEFSIDSPVKHAKSPMHITQLLDDLFDTSGTLHEIYYKALSALMQILASSVESDCLFSTNQKHANIVLNVKEIIELNYSRPDFSVEVIPKMLYISQSHMGKLFKEELGISPVSYLIDFRLQKAADILKNQSISVKELSRKVGFSDELYFMRRFKVKFGMTVKEYRKQFETNTTSNKERR